MPGPLQHLDAPHLVTPALRELARPLVVSRHSLRVQPSAESGEHRQEQQ